MFEILSIIFEIIQVVSSAVAAVVLLGFAALTIGGSALALAISTPLFVIFSPVLVPATLATTILATGFTASGSFGATALTILMRLYKQYTAKERLSQREGRLSQREGRFAASGTGQHGSK